MMSPNTARRWFSRVAWVGIAANLVLALAMMAAPVTMLDAASLPTATPDVWPRFAALLLALLSVFYMPAAIDPDRYRASAWFAVGARLVGVVFFLAEPPAYRMFALYDLAFFVPQAILLWLFVRGRAAAPASPQPRAAAV